MIHQNAKSFSLGLKIDGENIKDEAVEVMKENILELFEKVTFHTPVDEGTLRASWALSEESIGSYIAKKGSSELFDASTALENMKNPSHIWIYNNQPYADEIEYGHSSQAPKGMLRISIAEMKSKGKF